MHAILIHGWRGWPDNAWFPWLRKELASAGWTVDTPAMPNPMLPQRDVWVLELERVIRDAANRGIPASETVLIGHSLGCPTILFTLEKYHGEPFAKVVLVSGFARNYGVPGLALWMDHPIALESVRQKATQWVLLHGEKDLLVPSKEGVWLAEQLHVPLITTNASGHLIHEEGIRELPELREVLLGA